MTFRHSREEYVSAVSLGRSSVARGDCSSCPAWRASPPFARQSPALSVPLAARPRPYALTLHPCGSLAIWSLPIRARPCSLAASALPLCGAPPALSLPPCALRYARAHANCLPCAPCAEYLSVGCRGCRPRCTRVVYAHASVAWAMCYIGDFSVRSDLRIRVR